MFALALPLSACAIFAPSANSTVSVPEGAPDRAIERTAERREVTDRNIERVSFARPAPVLRGSRPMALTPCANGDPLTKNCRRGGDEHFVFPTPMPENAVVTPMAVAPVIADGQ